ncbi:hypothetical protein F0562_022810 [Nyssa sinensis]|uniref:Transcription factor MYB26 n=1 Tax=Nyssa sinensis TaxID=561372 RepID=A0A5J5BG36_9ASTE|nr:hypothetical protein F0562_022810 [Nyssa sinensis]
MGHHTCCNKQKVKRGLWSPEEDEKLINYISAYGHGCWSSVPRLAGLQRCGKSCRLRWINYLRPDLKRGTFSPQEAALIIELHRILGNRWSQIAKHLPGRTDNEVKNFWNSSIKKKLISDGLSDLATFSNLINPNVSFEGFWSSLNTNPNLIPAAQQDQVYIADPSSILQGFNHGDLKADQMNYIHVNLAPLPPPMPLLLDTPSYDSPSPLGCYQPQHQHVLKQEDSTLSNNGAAPPYYTGDHHEVINTKITLPLDDDPLMVPMMPKLCEIINGSMPYSSSVAHEVDPFASFSCSQSGSTTYPLDPNVLTNQMEYIDAIMSALPPSSSSSSSSMSLSSSLSPSSSSQFVVNHNLPSTSWDP